MVAHRLSAIGGGIAGPSHAAGYRAADAANTVSGAAMPAIRVAAVAEANKALAEDAVRRSGFDKALPGWAQVTEDPAIDAVSIVVGNDLHRPIAEALIAADKRVICGSHWPARWTTPGPRWPPREPRTS